MMLHLNKGSIFIHSIHFLPMNITPFFDLWRFLLQWGVIVFLLSVNSLLFLAAFSLNTAPVDEEHSCGTGILGVAFLHFLWWIMSIILVALNFHAYKDYSRREKTVVWLILLLASPIANACIGG